MGKENLYRFKIVGDPFCPCCPIEKETAHHVPLSCPRFDDIRCKLQTSFGELPTVGNFIRTICSSLPNWLVMQTACKEMLLLLRSVDFHRQTKVR